MGVIVPDTPAFGAGRAGVEGYNPKVHDPYFDGVSGQLADKGFVIAAADDLTGQAVVAYVTLGSGAVPEAELEARLREHVGRQIGKLARPSRIIWADDLPKTRSGKIMRRLLRDIAEDREPGDVTTLRDPSVLAQLQRNAHAGR